MKHQLVLIAVGHQPHRKEYIVILHYVLFSQDFEPQEDWQFPDSFEGMP